MEYTVDICGEINEKLVDEVVNELRAIYDFNCKMLDTYVNPPELYETIELNIDSQGGLLSGFIAIRKEVDKLKESGVKVNTYCSGLALSCGFLLMLLGESRWGDPLASYMVHQGLVGANIDKISSNARFLEHQGKIQEKMNEFVAENTLITIEELEKYEEIDLYMTHEEAIELGVLTKPKEVEEVELTVEQCIEIMKQNGYKVKEEVEEVEEKPKTKKKVKKSE